MPDKEKKPEFTVTDRRLFSSEGEIRPDVVEAEEQREEREQAKRESQQRANEARSAERAATTAETLSDPEPEPTSEGEYPGPPTTDEQRASAEAYKKSTGHIDQEIRKELDKHGQGHRAQDFEMNFEKFLASLYMSALMQMGMAAPEGGQPHVDLMGARQTIDIIGLLQDKTKGNLTSKEETMLQNVLYELRMAYLEVTNLIAKAPPPGKGGNGEPR
ncbi:MAG: DUF1844 domain-containing protein [Candidatus Korobacteraceae bacterium]